MLGAESGRRRRRGEGRPGQAGGQQGPAAGGRAPGDRPALPAGQAAAGEPAASRSRSQLNPNGTVRIQNPGENSQVRAGHPDHHRVRLMARRTGRSARTPPPRVGWRGPPCRTSTPPAPRWCRSTSPTPAAGRCRRATRRRTRVPGRLRRARACRSFIHASLLVNLGSPTAATVEKSAATLAHALRRGRAIGAAGVVFHAGSAVDAGSRRRGDAPGPRGAAAAAGRPRPRRAGRCCWSSRAPAAAGRWPPGWSTSGPYLDAVDRHPGLGVCFDTCHAWAAGHDLAAEGGMTATLDTLVATVGRGPAAAGARQRLAGPVRLDPGPARERSARAASARRPSPS